MAYFKISLLTPNLTNSYTFNEDVISEFFPQENTYENSLRRINDKDNISGYYDENGQYVSSDKDDAQFYNNRRNVFCYSYNEKITKNLNAQKTLSFSLNKFITIENEWHENPFARNILIGSQILLEDQYNNQYFFTVSSIKYNIKENNIIYDISCQDTFSYQSTRQNNGFTIKNETDSEDFIGALNIDEWIVNYIVPECHVPYTYLKLNEGLYQDNNNNYWTYSYGDKLQNVKTIIKYAYDKENNPEYYETIPFSCSGSNTNAALIALADTINFQIQTCEYKKNKNIGRFFWLEPKKNDQRLGLTYSPDSSIQSFNLTHDGKSLTTVLNVEGPTIDNTMITLIPEVPNFFINYFSNDDVWNSDKNKFFPGMFSSLCSDKQKKGDHWDPSKPTKIDENLFYFSNDINPLPIEEESELINKWDEDTGFYSEEGKVYLKIWDTDDKLFNVPYLYEQLFTRINNLYSLIDVNIDNTTITYSSLGTKTSLVLLTKDAADENPEMYEVSNESNFPILKKYTKAFFCFDTQQSFSSLPLIDNIVLYLDFCREVTEEEREFARIADTCPWLENKLIDFNYFKDSRIISKEEYTKILNTFQDTLRYINGKLLCFTSAYYNALHKQVETVANIQNNLDLLGANCQSDIINPVELNSAPKNIDSFKNTYSAVFYGTKTEITPQSNLLLNRNELLEEYFNKYADSQQRFLKNVYGFKNYFNAKNSLNLKGIYNYNFYTSSLEDIFNTLTYGQEEIVHYGFSTAMTNIINNNFKLYNKETYKPFVTCYKFNSSNGKYDTFELVHANNYKQFYLLDNSVVNINRQTSSSKYISGAQYYVPELWLKVEKVINDDKISYYYNDEEIKIKKDWTSSSDYSNTIKWNFQESQEESQEEPLKKRWKLYSFSSIDGQDYAVFRPIQVKLISSLELISAVLCTDDSTEVTIAAADLDEIKYAPVSSIDMFNNWLQGTNISTLGYHFLEEDCYTSFEDINKIIDNNNLNEYQQRILERILEDGSVRDINSESGSSYRYEYYRYLPINDIYAFLPKYVIQAEVDKNNNTSYLFKRYNSEGYDQKDFYEYIKETDESKKAKMRKVSNPYDYKEWQSFSYVKVDNASSFYRQVTSTAGLISIIASSFLLAGSLAPYSFLSLWSSIHSLGQKGYTNSDLWGNTLATDKSWDDWRDAEWRNKHRYATSEDALTKYYGYKNQIPQYNVFSKNNIYKGIWLYENGDFISDPHSNQWNDKYISNEATNRGIYWKLYGFNPALVSNSRYGSQFFVKDTRLYPLKLTSLLNKENIYRIIFLGPNNSEEDNKDRIFDKFSYDEVEGANRLSNFLFKESKDSISSIGYYPLNSIGGNLDLSQVEWNNKDSMTLEEILSQQDYDSIDSITSEDNKVQIIELTKDNTPLYFLFFREEKQRRSTVNESQCDYSLVPNFVNSGRNIYDDNNKKVNYKEDLDGWTEGYVVFKDLSEKLKPAAEIIDAFDPNLIYFDPVNLTQCPTILQVMNSTDTLYYYLGSQNHSEQLFKEKQNTFSLPIIKTTYKIEWIDEHHYSIARMQREGIEKQLNIEIDPSSYALIDDVWTANTRVIVDGINPIDITIKFELSEIIEGLTNGTFWNRYKNKIDTPILFENAAVIETKLEEYWQLALTASKYCEYFIPNHWQPQTDGDANALSSLVYYIDEENNAILRDLVLPNVKMYKDEHNETWLRKYHYALPEENKTILEYTQDELDADKNEAVSSKDSFKDIAKKNIAIQNIFKELNESIDNWVLTEYGYTTYYYCEDNSGMSWKDFVKNYTGESFEDFSGLYVMEYNILKKQYSERPMKQYKYWKEQHDIVWNSIYSNYGYLILENTYKNDTSTTATDLLKIAQFAFKDYSKPEAQYNLTTIDVGALQGYNGQEIRIGDGIKIDAKQMYNEYDQIFDSLSQYLFITDISYTLRTATDITLTVNSIKYQDKLIQKLVKLIK